MYTTHLFTFRYCMSHTKQIWTQIKKRKKKGAVFTWDSADANFGHREEVRMAADLQFICRSKPDKYTRMCTAFKYRTYSIVDWLFYLKNSVRKSGVILRFKDAVWPQPPNTTDCRKVDATRWKEMLLILSGHREERMSLMTEIIWRRKSQMFQVSLEKNMH